MKRLVSVAYFFALVMAAHAAGGRLHVVTSFFPIYCWTINVTEDAAKVENLLPPRVDPHDYAFSPGDARKLSAADMIVVNGLGLESWLPKFHRTGRNVAKRVVVISDGLSSELIEGHEHGHEHHRHDDGHDGHEGEAVNPHIWLDPILASHAVSNIAVALQRADGNNAHLFATNAAQYMAGLERLHADIQSGLAGVTNREIVTYHDAFPYFASRYGLKIAGIVEQVPEVNPSPRYLSRLGRMMRERGIRTIFIAPNAQSRLAARIARDLRVQLVELDTLESGVLTPAAYEDAMRRSLATLKQHLR